MPAVPVELRMPTSTVEDIEFVTDMDEVVESTKCSCNAGDDNPF